MRIMMTAVFSVLMTGAAWADATQEDWDRLGHPRVQAMADCAGVEIDRMLSTSMTDEAIADAAIAACEHGLEPLREILAKDPFNDSPEEIQAVIDQLKAEGRPVIVAEVEKRRN